MQAQKGMFPNNTKVSAKENSQNKELLNWSFLSLQVVQPYEVSTDTTQLVHTPKYTNKFFNGKTTEAEQRKTGFIWKAGLVRRCRLETGISNLSKCKTGVQTMQ